MRILIYVHSFAPKIGGVETFVMLLAQGLADLAAARSEDLKLTVVTPTPQDGFADEALPFRVVRRPGLWHLVRLLRDADIVHLAGPSFLPLFFGLLLRKAVVVEHHGYQAACPNGLLFYEPTKTVCPGHFMARRYQKCVECNRGVVGSWKSLLMLWLTFPRRWMCHRVARNTPISRHVLERLQLPRSSVIYYGVSDSLAGDEPIGASLRTSCLPCFAYVGRLVSEKGLSMLLGAARQLKDRGYAFRMKFIGDGPERLRLETLTGNFGLREAVTFTGYLQGDLLRGALRDVSVLVMPTLMEETAGLAAVEQMMRGRLVVVADIGGLGEVVGETGLKFPPADVEALTSCLRCVLDRPQLVLELGQRARLRAQEFFRQKRMTDEHLALYRQVLSERGGHVSR